MSVRAITSTLVLALCGGSAAAQAQYSFPRGFLDTEGNATFELGQTELFGQPLTRGLTVLDGTQLGNPMQIRALSLRQTRSQAPDAKSVASTLLVHMRIGHADLSKIPSSGPTTLSQVVSQWVTVHSGTKVSFPDLTTWPQQTPAQWSLRIPMPRPIVYDGNSAFALQCHAVPEKKGIAPLYAFDGVDESHAHSFGQGQSIGTGCKTHGISIRCEGFWTTPADIRRDVTLEVESFPAASEIRDETFLLVGLQDPDQDIGLCARLHATPDIVVPMNTPVFHGTNQDYGRGVTLRLPFLPQFVGLQVYLQSLGIDRYGAAPRIVASAGYQTGRLPARPIPSLRAYSSTAAPTPNGHPDFVLLTPNSAPILRVD